VVDDGAILVLGGLIEDRYLSNQSKVPLLGDIPYLGALFRSESRERKRTNLMVFLRPVVMRDSETQNKLSLDRYELIRAQQKDAQPPYSPLLRINETGVLPPGRRIDAPSPALPGTPQTDTPLAAPQTSPGTQGTPPSAEQRGKPDAEGR
jgi:general secretion pathway protein D